MRVARVRDSEQPVIALFFSVFGLLAFDYSDQPSFHNAAWERRLVHQDQDIDRVAVIGFGGRNESEVVGKHHSFGQHFLQLETALFSIECIFVAAASGRLDYHLHLTLIKDLQSNWIGNAILVFRHLRFTCFGTIIAEEAETQLSASLPTRFAQNSADLTFANFANAGRAVRILSAIKVHIAFAVDP